MVSHALATPSHLHPVSAPLQGLEVVLGSCPQQCCLQAAPRTLQLGWLEALLSPVGFPGLLH